MHAAAGAVPATQGRSPGPAQGRGRGSGADAAARRTLGQHGEDLAAAHLARAGYEVVARNWRCREGEIDLVVRDGATLVFVEVKTRRGTGFGLPAEAVTLSKARRLRVLACRFLATARPPGAAALRFDVVAVVHRPGVAPEVEHLRDAF